MNKPRLSRRKMLLGSAGAAAIAALHSSASLAAGAQASSRRAPLMIEDQGSFAVGGSVIRSEGQVDTYAQGPTGQTLHGDHAYVSYQKPVGAKPLPLVMWHGIGQFSKTWETTPDGREGFQNIFLRRRHSVYLIDQPRRGRAGRTTVSSPISTEPDDQKWFNTFRVGVWPNYNPGVQFSRDPEALNQYFRQMTPSTGPFDLALTAAAIVSLFDKIGPGVLVTHSHSGGLGWHTAMHNPNVKAVVSFEPGSNFPFPEGEVPAPVTSSAGPVEAIPVALDKFLHLTRIPILILYGDFIPATPDPNPGADGWRARLEMARKWRDAVNRRGGDVTVVHLPETGIHGNTHFPFSDLNNIEVADVMSAFLRKKKLG
ncbi:MAG: hypothetical protein RLZZ200_1084 [Pseudomonadota bacterium]